MKEEQELIYKFLGLHEHKGDWYDGKAIIHFSGSGFNPGFKDYWNDLMPVVEKVESIHDDYHGYFSVNITGNNCSVQGTNLRLRGEDSIYAYYNSVYAKTKIDATYRAVVDFIKWYNVNLKK